jgi:glutathione S-transferase
MAAPTVYGADYSVYIRTVRLALEEKGVDYRHEAVDIFADDGPPTGYEQRHPFLKIPAFEHNGFRLYEAAAIMRYVDEVFDGPALMPPRAGPGSTKSPVSSTATPIAAGSGTSLSSGPRANRME